MKTEKKKEVVRDINRLYSKKFENNVGLKEHIQRLVTYRLEDLRREVKDTTWKTRLMILTEALRNNPHNRDILEKLKGLQIPSDLRHIIWRTALNDPEIEREYSNLLRTDRVLTVSKFEQNIMEETQNYVSKYVSLDMFDAMMLQCMKTILSYIEKKQDRILSEFHYMLVMPLIVCFSELRWLLSSPSELIGMFSNILELAKFFDPYLEIPLGMPENYLKEKFETFLEILKEISPQMVDVIKGYCSKEGNFKAFSLMIKKFENSLGFYLLNVDNCLYVWDQILLKIKPMKNELLMYLAALFASSEEELLQVAERGSFSDFMEMVWLKSKSISKELFIAKYIDFQPRMIFYSERFNYEEIPVEDIRLGKYPIDNRLNPKGKSLKQMIEGDSNEVETEERKEVERNLSELIKNNVIHNPEEKEEFPEGEGMLIDGSMLDKMNKSNFGNKTEEDILAGISESKSRKKKSDKTSKKDRKSSRSKSKRDKDKKKKDKKDKKKSDGKSEKKSKKDGKSARSKSKRDKDKKKKKDKKKSDGKSERKSKRDRSSRKSKKKKG